MSLKEITAHLDRLSSAEKAELLKRLALELSHGWPGIEKLPDVAGGEACIAHTRIPVWVLDGYRRLGWSEAKILENYSTLHASDLVVAWAYADAHQSEMDNAIRKNEQA